MSIHAEYMRASDTFVEYAPEVNFVFPEEPGEAPVLVLSADEAVVFEGTHSELVGLANRILATLNAGPQEVGPA